VEESDKKRAIFPGLIYNEQGEPAEVVSIGGVDHYAIPDQGFKRHVEAWVIDDAIIAHLKQEVTSMQEEVVRSILQLLNTDDLFTKAAIDASIRNMEQSLRQGDPNQWVPWLGMMGFRVIVDVHGQIVDIIYPSQEDE